MSIKVKETFGKEEVRKIVDGTEYVTALIAAVVILKELDEDLTGSIVSQLEDKIEELTDGIREIIEEGEE